MAQYGLGKSSAIEDVFSDNVEDVSSYVDMESRADQARIISPNLNYNLSDKISEIPLKNVRASIFEAEDFIVGMIEEINSNMKKIKLSPYLNVEIETAHKAVWKDVTKNNHEAKIYQEPKFICFEEYMFASRHQCRACRSLIKEYDLAVGHTTFGHLVEIKKSLHYLLDELMVVKNISLYYLSEAYRDDTEIKIARYISDWAQSASHYAKQIAKEITAQPVSIPKSELDQISKKQAAQYQAFFSVKVNSLIAESQTILATIKRENSDVVTTFYKNYLMPALRMKSKVIDPVITEFNTTNLSSKLPLLYKEMVVANNAVTGNLGSITTDFLERNTQIYARFNGFLQALRLKRKYINYIVQLEEKGIKRQNILILEDIQDEEIYKSLFMEILVDSTENESLRSSHSDLDDIDGDAHPQYLRLDGGTITGDIFVADGVKIAGLDIAKHSHDDIDGSQTILSSSIDYETGRQNYYKETEKKPYGQIKVSSLNSYVLSGGLAEYEATFEIEIEDDKVDSYEFEILYKEI